MDDKQIEMPKVPKFKNRKEERKFWEDHWHEMGKYAGAEVAEQGYAFFKYESGKKKPGFFDSPTTAAQLYSEDDKRIEDDNLTELIGVRIGKRDLGELKAIAKEEDRALGSLLRLWLLQKKREYIWSHDIEF